MLKKKNNMLQKKNTWELVDLPQGRKLVKCKWVYKTKIDSDGSNFKYKEILVDKG